MHVESPSRERASEWHRNNNIRLCNFQNSDSLIHPHQVDTGYMT